MTGDRYEDEHIDALDERFLQEKQENCDHEWSRMNVVELCEPVEKGYIGGSEIIMLSIQCYNCGKILHMEGTVE